MTKLLTDLYKANRSLFSKRRNGDERGLHNLAFRQDETFDSMSATTQVARSTLYARNYMYISQHDRLAQIFKYLLIAFMQST